MAVQEVLQKDLEKVLKKEGLLFTRLRTPSYGRRGIRYPGDFVIWGKRHTWLVECKQRKSLPLAPSDIRQLKFMKDWVDSGYEQDSKYIILTLTPEGYCVFTHAQAVQASITHKGLRSEQAYFYSKTLGELIQKMEES